MVHHFAVAELVWSVLNERHSILGPGSAVEVHRKLTHLLAFLGVHFVFKVGEELLQIVNAVTTRYIADVDRCFENSSFVSFKANFADALVDQVSDFTAHDLGNLATLPPENVRGFLLALPPIVAHV